MDSAIMTFFLAFVQSATEFLPVSSSAHLVLCQSFGLTNQGIFSDVAMHAGTLIAIAIYFWRDLMRILKYMRYDSPERRLLGNIIVATIPILIGGAFGAEVFTRLRSPIIIAGTSIVFGVLLWVSDKMTKIKSDINSMTPWDALCIGLAQLLALVPGVSRSGIIITCCRALGFPRKDSTRFAMLLGIPAISAAVCYVLYQTMRYNLWGSVLTLEMFLGTSLAAMMGLAVIRFLMGWVRKSSFAIFAIYRVLLGLFVIHYFLS